eukprot:943499-Pleurochrysis_carterae.AAC.3
MLQDGFSSCRARGLSTALGRGALSMCQPHRPWLCLQVATSFFSLLAHASPTCRLMWAGAGRFMPSSSLRLHPEALLQQ